MCDGGRWKGRGYKAVSESDRHKSLAQTEGGGAASADYTALEISKLLCWAFIAINTDSVKVKRKDDQR